MANEVADYMEFTGVEFIRSSVPTQFTKLEDGKIEV